ncbi:glycosyltransferase [Epidermidibacterium keratini]|uniref:Glycosyltransferase n=1 Tax=Epidermidibacterium keratini TaxID=1891644 RepID=A0A7L4YR50_9ACTN|nr:glycosyltransferase family 1 protein [Epidermidibacterium keratini]QHC01542.1 glycosyltransferase [Epidermidibacterium keratini]
MRVTLDATPLLGQRTGIGTYVERVLGALSAGYLADDWAATAFTWRGREALPDRVPPSVDVHARPAPARALHAAWLRANFPAVEAICGRTDVFHGTNFVLPPLQRAAGVLTVHDLAYLRYPHTVARASLAYAELVPRGLRRAAAVTVVSQAMAHQLLEAYRFPAERVVVTPLGVDPTWFTATSPAAELRRELGLPAEYVVAVGTLEPRKNLGALLDVWRARPELPPLVLVGGAGWGQALDASGIAADKLIRTGHLGAEQVREVVAGASLLAFPSLDEGFGLPPLEALATGTPVMAADIPVTREVLGDQAAYADPRDVEAIADAIATALHEPVGTRQTRQDRAATFTWQRCAERTHAAYELALG